MLAFIKTHLISLVSGVAALAFIVIGVLGMMSDSVVLKMQERVNQPGVSQISTLRQQAKNDACIQAEAERGRLFQQEYDQTCAVAQHISERKPLMDDVFPAATRIASAYDFRDAYVQAMERLPRGKIMGGDSPNDREKTEAAEEIAEREEREKAERDEGGPTAKPISPGGPDRAPGSDAAPVMGGMIGGGMIGGMIGGGRGMGMPGYSSTPAGELGDPKKDPVARAAITKARGIRCYVGPSALQFSPILDPNVKPTPDEMWYAQVALWVQEDVINAVAQLNDEAAKKLKEDAQYVENMPVKRVQSIRVLGYLTPKGPVPFKTYAFGPGGSAGAAGAGGDLAVSFTGRKSDNQFDVIRFDLVVVMDQRELPKLIDRITKQNFYELIKMSYRALPPNADVTEGYLYGEAPVVRANLSFEGYMARSVYESMFPAEVREALGIGGKK